MKNAVGKGTYTAVDTKNPNNNTENMMYGGNDDQQMTSTSYPFLCGTGVFRRIAVRAARIY